MSFRGSNLPIQLFVNDYGNTGRSWAALDYFRSVSDANTSINLTPNVFLRAEGKLRSVIVNYWPILCDEDGACDANICDAGEAVEPKQQIFNITRCTASKVRRVNKDDVRLTDSGEWDFTGIANAIIQSMLPSMRKVLAVEMVTYAYELAGVHTDGNETHRVTVTNPTNGVVNPLGRFDINREYLDAGFTTPYVLGGQEVYNWMSMVNIGGINAQGQQIGQLSTANSWYDDGLSDEILNELATGGHILSIAPEVFKYIWYLENAGIFRTGMASQNDFNALFLRGSETVLNGTLVDPVTGIPWDLDIYYSPCGKFWNFQIRHNWDFFVMPDIACNGEGVNGIMHWRTCPPVLATCPAGDAVPSPAAVVEYSWTPGDIFPFYMANSTIGTVDNEPKVTITNLADLVAAMNDAYSSNIFTVDGSNVVYDGYTALSGDFNDEAIEFTFS